MSEGKKGEADRRQHQIRRIIDVKHIREADTEKRGRHFCLPPPIEDISVFQPLAAASAVSFTKTAAAEEENDNPQTAVAAEMTFTAAESIAA